MRLQSATTLIYNEASQYLWARTITNASQSKTTHAPKLPNANHTKIPLCKTNLFTATLQNASLKNPRPISTTTASSQQDHQTDHDNYWTCSSMFLWGIILTLWFNPLDFLSFYVPSLNPSSLFFFMHTVVILIIALVAYVCIFSICGHGYCL
jgi:hypothetical protein